MVCALSTACKSFWLLYCWFTGHHRQTSAVQHGLACAFFYAWSLCQILCGPRCHITVQGPAKKLFPGCENFVLAVAYHFCLALPEKFSQLGNHSFAGPCIAIDSVLYLTSLVWSTSAPASRSSLAHSAYPDWAAMKRGQAPSFLGAATRMRVSLERGQVHMMSGVGRGRGVRGKVARWQNLIPSFPWIAPGRRAWGRNPRKGRKGSNFAAQRSGAIVQKPEGPNTYNSKNPAIAIWQPWSGIPKN